VKPGDVITCITCGAKARARWTSRERAWQEGWALLLTWTHGPHPRHEAATEVPERCLWCHERCEALGKDAAPLYRPAPGAELEDEPGSVGEGPFRVEPGDRSGSSSSVQKAPLERSAGQLGLFGGAT
jgi:hypothetical protein